jgi:hypothetical protein
MGDLAIGGDGRNVADERHFLRKREHLNIIPRGIGELVALVENAIVPIRVGVRFHPSRAAGCLRESQHSRLLIERRALAGIAGPRGVAHAHRHVAKLLCRPSGAEWKESLLRNVQVSGAAIGFSSAVTSGTPGWPRKLENAEAMRLSSPASAARNSADVAFFHWYLRR